MRIFADKEYEASETFQIFLSDLVTAALEIPAITTIEIVDPGEGMYHFSFSDNL